jgi:HAE1 family hydrophobic/amphiphilic exporter-1
MFALVTAAVVALATPAPSPVPVPIATPGIIATPASTNGLVIPPAPAVAPILRPGATPQLPSGDIVGVSGPFVGISLDDVVAMALAHDTDLAVAQSNRRIARFSIVAAQGAYDLKFFLQPSYSFSQQPSESVLESGPNNSPLKTAVFGSQAGISGLLPSGGNVSLTTGAQRTDNNLSVNSYNPYYQTSAQLNFSQPLARGRKIDEQRREIQLNRINSRLQTDTALLDASNALSNALDTYYDLIAAWRNVSIQEDGLLQAKAQSESNARLVKQGASAPVDVVESNTQVDVFQDNVYSAIQNVSRLQTQLKQLILSDPADPIWTVNLVPVSPVTDILADPQLDDVMLAALKTRPEVAQLRDEIGSANVEVTYAREQTKPQIDLNLGIGEVGFAGQPAVVVPGSFLQSFGSLYGSVNQLIGRVNALTPTLPPLLPVTSPQLSVPPNTIGNIGTAYSSMFRGEYPQYSIGATIAFPLRDRTAQANAQAAVEQRRQLETDEVALIQRIQVESRNAIQSYRTARSRVVAAQAAREAAEIVAASELRKFRAGSSTTFLVLQRQIDLANQRGRELQAQTDLEKALVQLDVVTGSILAKNHVDVDALGGGAQGATALTPASTSK